MSLESQIDRKKYTTILFGNTLRNDLHSKTQNFNQRYYKTDMGLYHDTPQERWTRNKEQITELISLIRSHRILPEMLEFQVGNSFYPSYILYHHFAHFTKIIEQLIDAHPEQSQFLAQLLQQSRQYKKIGAIFRQSINLDFKSSPTKTTIINGAISMPEKQYFYSFKTSLHLHVCCAVMKVDGQTCYAFVRLRNDGGEFMENVEVKDLGATISSDYASVGYRLHGVKPFCVIYSKSGRIYRGVSSDDSTVEFGYSIKDLMTSLRLTTQYTSMRKQFKTLDQSKAERPILSYQAVGSRIVDGYAHLFSFAYLRQRLLNMPLVKQFLKPYSAYFHQMILERLIDLRQCCGGFGFMQVSGHPALIERTMMRSAQNAATEIPQIPEVMKRVHYFTSDMSMYPNYMSTVSADECKNKDILGIFCIVAMNMRKNRHNLDPKQYARQFFIQSCYQTMYTTISQYAILENGKTYLVEDLLLYSMINYVIKNAKYIDWSFCKVPIEKYTQSLFALKNKKLQHLTQQIPVLKSMLEITHDGNVIVGRADSQAFYTEVLETSKSNRRNSEEYRKYVQQPLIKLIKQQRAKL